MKVFCSKCGKELPEKAKYCDVCGSKIINCEEEKITNDQKKKKRNLSMKMIAAVLAVIIAGGMATGLIIWQNGSKAVKTSMSPANMNESGNLDSAVQNGESSVAQTRAEAGREDKKSVGEAAVEKLKAQEFYIHPLSQYKEIATESYEMYEVWNCSICDVDGNGLCEMLLQYGELQESMDWKVYSYNIRTGEVYLAGTIDQNVAYFMAPTDGSSGLVMVGEDNTLTSVKLNSSGMLETEDIAEESDVENIYEIYSEEMFTNYCCLAEPDDMDWFFEVGAPAMNSTRPTGLKNTEGIEFWMYPTWAVATSAYQEKGINYSVDKLDDLDDLSGVWKDGAEGDGTGEAIIIQLQGEAVVDGLAILPGNFDSKEIYENSGRPTKLIIKYSNSSTGESETIYKDISDFEMNFENPLSSIIYIDFGETVTIDECEVMIAEMTSGDDKNTCISRMFLYHEGEIGY